MMNKAKRRGLVIGGVMSATALASTAVAIGADVRGAGELHDLQTATEQPFDHATAQATAAPNGDGTTVTLKVQGIDHSAAGSTFGAHVHSGSCVIGTGSVAGPHYKHDANVASTNNEVWLDFTVEANGTARRRDRCRLRHPGRGRIGRRHPRLADERQLRSAPGRHGRGPLGMSSRCCSDRSGCVVGRPGASAASPGGASPSRRAAGGRSSDTRLPPPPSPTVRIVRGSGLAFPSSAHRSPVSAHRAANVPAPGRRRRVRFSSSLPSSSAPPRPQPHCLHGATRSPRRAGTGRCRPTSNVGHRACDNAWSGPPQGVPQSPFQDGPAVSGSVHAVPRNDRAAARPQCGVPPGERAARPRGPNSRLRQTHSDRRSGHPRSAGSDEGRRRGRGTMREPARELRIDRSRKPVGCWVSRCRFREEAGIEPPLN